MVKIDEKFSDKGVTWGRSLTDTNINDGDFFEWLTTRQSKQIYRQLMIGGYHRSQTENSKYNRMENLLAN